MSRHREAVQNLAASLASTAAAGITDDVAQQLMSAQDLLVLVQPLAVADRSSAVVRSLRDRLAAAAQAANLADMQDLDVEIHLTPRERIGRCVAGSVYTSRRLQVVDVKVKARVQTRWIHLWEERAVTRQWALG